MIRFGTWEMYYRLDADALHAAVREALDSYRCQHTRDCEDDGMVLVDVLTPPGQADITLGQAEMKLLAEHVACELETKIMAAITPEVGV